MKIAIFNVGNAACSLLVCPNGNSFMIDCGCHSNQNPIDTIKRWKQPGGWLSGMKTYTSNTGTVFPLTMVGITHPDEDHIRNIERLHKEFPPFLIHRRYVETYPTELANKPDSTFSYYREQVCKNYRDFTFTEPNWAINITSFSIPMYWLQQPLFFPPTSIMNNSSHVYLVEYNGYRILYGGDMEEIGWDWLINFNPDFLTEIKKGIHTFVVSHHGHKSGYSPKLTSAMPKPAICILSKASETGEETDVCSSYSAMTSSALVTAVNPTSTVAYKKTLTTRNNGNILIDVGPLGQPNIYCEHF